VLVLVSRFSEKQQHIFERSEKMPLFLLLNLSAAKIGQKSKILPFLALLSRLVVWWYVSTFSVFCWLGVCGGTSQPSNYPLLCRYVFLALTLKKKKTAYFCRPFLVSRSVTLLPFLEV